MPHDVAGSAWANQHPGLPDQAERLLRRIPKLLEESHDRAERVLSTPVLTPTTIGRIGRLAAMTAPDLLPALRRRNAEAIVPVLARLALNGGPTFVKLGQLMSSMGFVLPDWVAEPFAGTRDAVPPADAQAIEAVLVSSGITRHLVSWDREPLASASVAQVHRATLDDGREVVLKVRRPGIVATVASDASWLLPALRFAEGRDDRLRVANLHGTVELMIRLFAQEVDLRLEAANIVEMALAFERAGQALHVPIPIPGLVTRRVVALEFIDGVSAASTEEVARFGHHAEALVRLAITGTLTTAMVDGIFHGDLHLGNVMVTPNGLALIDFGIVGRLTPVQRRALMALLMAAIKEDRSAAFAALSDFGALPGVDLAEFESRLPPRMNREARRAAREEGGRDFVAERITSFVRELAAAGFRVPPELALFAKNLVYLGDAVARHAPDLDMMQEIGGAVATIAAHLQSDPTES
ncbi:MAG: ABC1 kinase family protein [Acidimicrobiales bacterium]